MPNILVSFGKRVKELRLVRGITQQDLAERAKVHRSYIGEVELGRRNVSLLTIYKIALALDIPITTLLQTSESTKDLQDL